MSINADPNLVAAESPIPLPLAPTISSEPAATKMRRRGRVTFWVSLAWLIVVVIVAVLGDKLPFVFNPYRGSVLDGKEAPSAAHWFGTDANGRDVFSRCVYGARTSIAIGVVSIVLGLTVGGVLGLLAGYYRRRIDWVVSIAMDVVLAFPALVLAIAIITFRGRTAANVVAVLAILSVPGLARLVRANTMVFSQREFVLAARSLGARNRRVIFREVLPNVVPVMLTFALTGLAILIVSEAGLAFVGASIRPPTPTWGGMIADGRDKLEDAWWISIFPSLVLFLTVLAVNLIGDVLSARFNVKESVG